MQTGVAAGKGSSVGLIFCVGDGDGDGVAGGGVIVGGVTTGFPHDESMIAAARSKNNCFFILSRLYKEIDKGEYSTTKLAGQLPNPHPHPLGEGEGEDRNLSCVRPNLTQVATLSRNPKPLPRISLLCADFVSFQYFGINRRQSPFPIFLRRYEHA